MIPRTLTAAQLLSRYAEQDTNITGILGDKINIYYNDTIMAQHKEVLKDCRRDQIMAHAVAMSRGDVARRLAEVGFTGLEIVEMLEKAGL